MPLLSRDKCIKRNTIPRLKASLLLTEKGKSTARSVEQDRDSDQESFHAQKRKEDIIFSTLNGRKEQDQTEEAQS
jgi:hypothetical protein